LEWDGFKPRAYVLNWEKISGLPLTEASSGQQMTIGEILETFHKQKVELDDRTTELALKSESKELVVRGMDFHRELLQIVYRIEGQDLSPYDVWWFYYDSDSSKISKKLNWYNFFWVVHNKIVDEDVSLGDTVDNGFDPNVLVPITENESRFYVGEKAKHQAEEKFWYRKFYTETRTGQLMLLRPDKPEIYYYREQPWRKARDLPLSTEESLFHINVSLRSIRFALWALVLVGALLLYSRLR
jgi:hypothetical protein